MHFAFASLLIALGTPASSHSASDTVHCVDAAAFLRASQHMQVVVKRDTIDDWRTHKRVSGCSITAAGGAPGTVQAEAVKLYERIRAAGWTRTPDPADSPNEASLRFRQGKSDCLFNVNAQALLNTDAENTVNARLKLKPGETYYEVYVMCMPAMPAGVR